VFIPAVNRAGPDGWDMVKVATDIKLNAQAQGNEVCVEEGEQKATAGSCRPAHACSWLQPHVCKQTVSVSDHLQVKPCGMPACTSWR
jgi:hypothetical protein